MPPLPPSAAAHMSREDVTDTQPNTRGQVSSLKVTTHGLRGASHMNSAHLMPGDCGPASSTVETPTGPPCPPSSIARPKRVNISWFRLARAVVGVANSVETGAVVGVAGAMATGAVVGVADAMATGAAVGVAGWGENSFNCKEIGRQLAV